MAQAVFIMYPGYLFGAIFGSISLANGVLSLVADPLFRKVSPQRLNAFYHEQTIESMKRMIQGALGGDYTVVHNLFGALCLISALESLVLIFVKHK